MSHVAHEWAMSHTNEVNASKIASWDGQVKNWSVAVCCSIRSQVAYINESCRTWMSHVSYIDESRLVYVWVVTHSVFLWDMTLCMSHVSQPMRGKHCESWLIHVSQCFPICMSHVSQPLPQRPPRSPGRYINESYEDSHSHSYPSLEHSHSHPSHIIDLSLPFEWVMSHKCMSHEWVMFYSVVFAHPTTSPSKSHGRYRNESLNIHHSCLAYEWVMSHIWMSHKWVMNESWMSHVSHMDYS